MSDVQRWAEGFRGGGVRAADGYGEWVTYADHARIVAEAEAALAAQLRECEACADENRRDGYERGRADAEQAHAAALGDLRAAVEDEGPVSSYHRDVMRRHRKEWPTLWKAIDALIHDGEATPQGDMPYNYVCPAGEHEWKANGYCGRCHNAYREPAIDEEATPCECGGAGSGCRCEKEA